MELLNHILSLSTLPLLTAFLLGVMTMISPCPFCSDVTAIAFLSKNVRSRRAIFWNGMCYVLGKCFSYLLLALVFIFGAQIEGVREAFEHYGEPVLGPFLIVVGALIWWIGYRESQHSHENAAKAGGEEGLREVQNGTEHHHHEHHHEHAPHRLIRKLSESDRPWLQGGLGSFILGVVFALAFCPYSGLLYFGTLIPLTLLQPATWSWMMPVCFGLGDALPVLAIALLISYNIRTMGTINGNLQKLEVWLRRICVAVFVGFGLYLTISVFSGHHHHEHIGNEPVHTELVE